MADPSRTDIDSREKYFVDIDRMINEGLGGGQVSDDANGLIEDSTAHTFTLPESALHNNAETPHVNSAIDGDNTQDTI